MAGIDVTAHKRAVYRYLGATYAWNQFRHANWITRRTYGPSFDKLVNDARRKVGLKVGGGVDKVLYTKLRAVGAYDAYGDSLLLKYAAAHPGDTLVYPFPQGYSSSICQGLHETGGLPNNWAIDFCARPGTPVVAVEAGVISRLSGKAPGQDVNDPTGAFGWSVYIEALRTYTYFITHLGTRPSELRVGLKVQPGDLIGHIGDQDFRDDHCHYGVSSTKGPADAKKRITAVSKARRIH
jgi:murein DD-endopeptidase MepM/ murein hydrolase activator NlpD